MKKQIKKRLSAFLPKGLFKEKVKSAFYNLTSKSGTRFSLEFRDKLYYRTQSHGQTFLTVDPLYSITPDFDYYLHFRTLSPGDVAIDAGANRGYISVYFSKLVGAGGRVYAFEPDAFNINYIKRNLQLDQTLSENVVIQDLLLWDECKTLDFYEAGTVGSSAVIMPDADKIVKKEAITIDEWVRRKQVQKLDFIKMDIEGAEIEAVQGCVETIKNLSPDFAIASYHIVDGQPTYIKLEQFFKEIGYPYKTVRFKNSEIITFAGPSVKKIDSTTIR